MVLTADLPLFVLLKCQIGLGVFLHLRVGKECARREEKILLFYN